MKKIFILIWSVPLIFISCKSERQDKLQKVEEHTATQTIEYCINPEFYECVKTYISQVKGRFPFDEVHYSAYFFKKDTARYFTLWTFVVQADGYLESINNPLLYKNNYAYYSIEKMHYIGLISPKGYDSKLYNGSCDFLKKTVTEVDEIFISYDGSWYPKTYWYYFKDGKCIINESDVILVDFLDDYPLEWHENNP